VPGQKYLKVHGPFDIEKEREGKAKVGMAEGPKERKPEGSRRIQGETIEKKV